MLLEKKYVLEFSNMFISILKDLCLEPKKYIKEY